MRLGHWEERDLRRMTLAEMLVEVEDSYGVALAVGVTRDEDAPGDMAMWVYAGPHAPEHISEWFGVGMVLAPMMDIRLISLETQLVMAAAAWCDKAIEAGHRSARPS